MVINIQMNALAKPEESALPTKVLVVAKEIQELQCRPESLVLVEVNTYLQVCVQVHLAASHLHHG